MATKQRQLTDVMVFIGGFNLEDFIRLIFIMSLNVSSAGPQGSEGGLRVGGPSTADAADLTELKLLLLLCWLLQLCRTQTRPAGAEPPIRPAAPPVTSASSTH